MGLPELAKEDAIQYAKNLLNTAVKEFLKKNYSVCECLLSESQQTFRENNMGMEMSVLMSVDAGLKYVRDKNNYKNSMAMLEDAKYLAVYTQNHSAKLVSEYFYGLLNKLEKNWEISKIYYNNAKIFAVRNDEYGLFDSIIKGMEELSIISKNTLSSRRDPLLALVKIGQSLAAETTLESLLRVITEETKIAIQADRCTVFLYDKENEELWSKVAMGIGNSEIRFPAGKGLAGHVVKTGEPINIKDAYNDVRFNKEIDIKTGYKTKTILCMPIKNMKQEIIGAFQVLNKLEGCFNDEDEDLLVAIGSSAGIALENAQLFETQNKMLEEQKVVFDSFIETLAASIDARDKITAGHSTRVKIYAGLIARKFGLDEKLVQVIEKAAVLHDIGKIGIRDSVLQKEGKLTDEEYKHIQQHVVITHDILQKIHMSDDFKMITEIACSHHEKYNGSGYYRQLSGENIPFGGRILAVSDVFDAITSKRHYRDKMPIKKVIDILIKDSGTHFDSSIVKEFLDISCDQIIDVFLTENHLILREDDRKLLSKYSLKSIHDYIQSNPETLTPEQQNFISLFNTYYYGHEVSKEESYA